MTTSYQIEIEVRPVANEKRAKEILEVLNEAGMSIEDDNCCPTDDAEGYVFAGTISLCGGTTPEEAHKTVAVALGSGVRLASRWLNLEATKWDHEFADE